MDRLKLILTGIVAALAPVHAAMGTVFLVIVVDLLSGIIAASRREEKIVSYKLKKTIIKVAVYELAIVLAFIIGEYLTGPTVPVLNMVASVIGLTEFKSILENFQSINGGSVFDAILRNVSSHTESKPGGPRESNGPSDEHNKEV